MYTRKKDADTLIVINNSTPADDVNSFVEFVKAIGGEYPICSFSFTCEKKRERRRGARGGARRKEGRKERC
jgi:hypothetical protein